MDFNFYQTTNITEGKSCKLFIYNYYLIKLFSNFQIYNEILR